MSHDIVADALNKMMNAKRAGKSHVLVKMHSKLLISVLAIAKLKGYVRQYALENGVLHIELAKIHGCQAIKPRSIVTADEIDNYVRRFLPAKNIGVLVISTSKGLMTHQTAQEKKIGGNLLAYFY